MSLVKKIMLGDLLWQVLVSEKARHEEDRRVQKLDQITKCRLIIARPPRPSLEGRSLEQMVAAPTQTRLIISRRKNTQNPKAQKLERGPGEGEERIRILSPAAHADLEPSRKEWAALFIISQGKQWRRNGKEKWQEKLRLTMV